MADRTPEETPDAFADRVGLGRYVEATEAALELAAEMLDEVRAAVAEEREVCARLAESMASDIASEIVGASEVAAAIRARGGADA